MEFGSRYEFHILPVESELTIGQKLPISGSVLCNVVAQPSEKKHICKRYFTGIWCASEGRLGETPDRNLVLDGFRPVVTGVKTCLRTTLW